MDHSDFENAYRAFRQVSASGDIPDLMPFSYESCERVEKGNWRLFAGLGVAQVKESARSVSGKRKQDGIVYTPDAITRFIVDETLGA